MPAVFTYTMHREKRKSGFLSETCEIFVDLWGLGDKIYTYRWGRYRQPCRAILGARALACNPLDCLWAFFWSGAKQFPGTEGWREGFSCALSDEQREGADVHSAHLPRREIALLRKKKLCGESTIVRNGGSFIHVQETEALG